MSTEVDFRRELAGLLSGLAVPRSIDNGRVLGKAKGHWDALWDYFGVFGWQNEDEVLALINKKWGLPR